MITTTRCFLTSNLHSISVKFTHIRLSIFEKHPPQIRKMASSSSAPAAARKTFWDFKPVDSMLLHFF